MANASLNTMEGTMQAPEHYSLPLTTLAVVVGFLSLAAARADAGNGACTTASDCQDLLPRVCMMCDDGLGRCARWVCEEGTCAIRMCELPPPYDLTGHWSGSETTSASGGTLALSADLTSTSAQKFTGMMTAGEAISCTVKGKRTKKVKARLSCTEGSKIMLTGRLDRTARTITGTLTWGKHAKRKKVGTFTLTRTSA
jgi:hypothetical protein